MASVLRVDELQSTNGSPVMTFGSDGSVDFSGGLAPTQFVLPVWTTETRPTPQIGLLGFNTDTETVEIYASADKEWISISGQSTSADWTGIVTNGLMIHLDALNPESYNGSGSVWYDFSGNSRNATMSNLSSSNWVTLGNTKAFETNDTSNQGFRVANFPFPQSSGRTYELWFNSKSYSIGWQTWFDDNATERILFGTSSNTMQIYPDLNFTANLQTGVWYHLVYTLDSAGGSTAKAYLNGALLNSGTYSSAITTGTGTLYILGDPGSEITSGYCSIARVYNRPLTSTEILQNYNAQKARHGY